MAATGGYIIGPSSRYPFPGCRLPRSAVGRKRQPSMKKRDFVTSLALFAAFAGLALLVAGCGKKNAYSVPSLLETLKSKDPGMRYYAARELGQFRPKAKDAIPSLTEALKDNDKKVRMGAAYALGEIGPDASTAIPALKASLKDTDAGVRKGAAYALKQIQNPNPKAQQDDKSKSAAKQGEKSKKPRHKSRHKRDAGKSK